MSKFKTASAMMQEWEETSKRIQTEADIRADERAKTIKEVYKRFNSDLGSFGFWLYEQLKEQEGEQK